jgi:hypothetical protein
VVSAGEGFGLGVEGDTELVEGLGGRPVATRAGRRHAGETVRDGGRTPRKRDGSLGSQRAHGKASNARLATVKAREEAGKANHSLPCVRRGDAPWSDPGSLDTRAQLGVKV